MVIKTLLIELTRKYVHVIVAAKNKQCLLCELIIQFNLIQSTGFVLVYVMSCALDVNISTCSISLSVFV